jgi:hypothetical protein
LFIDILFPHVQLKKNGFYLKKKKKEEEDDDDDDQTDRIYNRREVFDHDQLSLLFCAFLPISIVMMIIQEYNNFYLLFRFFFSFRLVIIIDLMDLTRVGVDLSNDFCYFNCISF